VPKQLAAVLGPLHSRFIKPLLSNHLAELARLTYVVNREIFEVKGKKWLNIPADYGRKIEIDKKLLGKIVAGKPEAWRSVPGFVKMAS
jgi:hypothetical protein